MIKDFFRDIPIGNEKSKNRTVSEIKDLYDNEDFKQDDVYDIAIDTDKEEELFDYADISKNYSTNDYVAITLCHELGLNFDIKLAQMCFIHDIGEAVMKEKKYSKDYNMSELFEKFYDYQVSKRTFEQGTLKEMFENLKNPNKTF